MRGSAPNPELETDSDHRRTALWCPVLNSIKGFLFLIEIWPSNASCLWYLHLFRFYSHIPIFNMGYAHQPLSQRSSSDFSKDTLLEKDEYYLPSPPPTTLWSRARMLILHGVLITIYSVICFVVVQKANNRVNAVNSNLIECKKPLYVLRITY